MGEIEAEVESLLVLKLKVHVKKIIFKHSELINNLGL
jgi:hypothetical protein